METAYLFTYETSILACKEIESLYPTALGFDTEADVASGKADIISLATDSKSYVFQLSRMLAVPKELKSILENESILKLGVNIAADSKRCEPLDIKVFGTIDLGYIAKMKELPKGLKELWQHFYPEQEKLIKVNHCSVKWSDPLSESLLHYAASDAMASLFVGYKLLNVSKEPKKQLPTEQYEPFVVWLKEQVKRCPRGITFRGLVNQTLNSYAPFNMILKEERAKLAERFITFAITDLNFDYNTVTEEIFTRGTLKLINEYIGFEDLNSIKGLKYSSAINYLCNACGRLSKLSMSERREIVTATLQQLIANNTIRVENNTLIF